MEKRNLNTPNPKLEVGDRIKLIHMDGEDIPMGSKGIVIGFNNYPKMRSTDSGTGYWVEFYDADSEKFLSKLTLIPEEDIWLYDKEYYNSKSLDESLNEERDLFSNSNNIDKWVDFFKSFRKSELNDICELLELERRSGFSNMYSEGGRFLLTGPDYIKDFLKMKSYEKEFNEKDKKIHKAILSRAQEVRDIFIRGSMKYLENKGQETEIPRIQKMMPKLANMAKDYWMGKADKYINKEIE